MMIAFYRGWHQWPADSPFDFADGQANELVRLGVARRIDDPAKRAEMAVAEPAMMAENASFRGKRRRT